jgi:hypothetical protein
MPYLIGGTITGTIMVYYYVLLITIIVNSVIGLLSQLLLTNTIGNIPDLKKSISFIKIYWPYKRKKKSRNNFNNRDEKYTGLANVNKYFPQKIKAIIKLITWDAH